MTFRDVSNPHPLTAQYQMVLKEYPGEASVTRIIQKRINLSNNQTSLRFTFLLVFDSAKPCKASYVTSGRMHPHSPNVSLAAESRHALDIITKSA